MSSTKQEHTVDESKFDADFWSALFRQDKVQRSEPNGRPDIAPDHSSALSVSWRLAEDAFRADHVLELRVTGFNKGGLLVDWQDLQGFVPASQLVNFPLLHIARERLHALAGQQGRMLQLKIIELNPEKNRLVLSERAAQVGIEQRVNLLFHLRSGDVVSGRVTNLSDFGAFVDLGGIEGLIHISELSWSRVGHPSHVVQPGQDVEVKVIQVDRERERIALSYKQLRPNPWQTAEEHYRPDDLVRGVVSHVASFGAFVILEEELEGLIHVSEMSDTTFVHPHNVVKEGDHIIVRVMHVDGTNKRLALSLRHVALSKESPRDA